MSRRGASQRFPRWWYTPRSSSSTHGRRPSPPPQSAAERVGERVERPGGRRERHADRERRRPEEGHGAQRGRDDGEVLGVMERLAMGERPQDVQVRQIPPDERGARGHPGELRGDGEQREREQRAHRRVGGGHHAQSRGVPSAWGPSSGPMTSASGSTRRRFV